MELLIYGFLHSNLTYEAIVSETPWLSDKNLYVVWETLYAVLNTLYAVWNTLFIVWDNLLLV